MVWYIVTYWHKYANRNDWLISVVDMVGASDMVDGKSLLKLIMTYHSARMSPPSRSEEKLINFQWQHIDGFCSLVVSLEVKKITSISQIFLRRCLIADWPSMGWGWGRRCEGPKASQRSIITYKIHLCTNQDNTHHKDRFSLVFQNTAPANVASWNTIVCCLLELQNCIQLACSSRRLLRTRVT